MDIRMWILFGCSLVFLLIGIYIWFAGRKEWKKEEAAASVAATLLKEAKLYNQEATQTLIQSAQLLDETNKKLEEWRIEQNVKIVNSDPRMESGEVSNSDTGFDPAQRRC